MGIMTKAALLGAASQIFAVAPAWAQNEDPGNSDAGRGQTEIVVTAQKRTQALIDVPLSISAVSNAEIAKRGASTINDLQYSVPGLSMTEFSPGQTRVQMRGVSVYSGLPTVGVYLDEMPLNLELNQTGQDVRLLDISRVEVLRGPQGTLYGQGAVSGTIRYITNDVKLDRTEGMVGGEVGMIDGGGTNWKIDGVANTPIVTDRIGLRLAGSFQQFGGWIDNPVLGEKNYNSGHAFSVRGKLAVKLTDDFKITFMAQHQNLDLGAQNLSNDDKQVFDVAPAPYKSKATMLNATATYDLGDVQLLSSTGYLKRRDDLIQDFSATFKPFLPLLGITDPVDSIVAKRLNNNKIFTQELRLASQGNGPLNWTIGGFYRNSRTSTATDTTVTPNILPPSIVLYRIAGTEPDNSKSWAVFGEASYKLLDSLTVLAGLRYFEDRRHQDTTSTVFNSPANDRGSAKFDTLNPRFNISWQPTDDVNLYTNVAKGFRSGGFNLTSASGGFGTVPQTYDPDSIWTYEVGGKFRSADRKFSAEFALYRNEWSGVQTTTNIPGLPTSFTTNAGKISGWGVDGNLSYSPVSPLTFTLTGGWNNMEYKSNSAEHFAGDRVDYVPRFTGSASAEYRFDVAALPSFVRVDYQHAQAFQVFIRNFQAAPARSDEQNILNARVGVEGESWSASVFAKNILNRDSIVYPSFASLVYDGRLEPRVIGASFSVHY